MKQLINNKEGGLVDILARHPKMTQNIVDGLKKELNITKNDALGYMDQRYTAFLQKNPYLDQPVERYLP